MRPNLERFLAPAAIALAAVAAYADSFAGPLVFDDVKSIAGNPTLRRLSDLGAVLRPPDGLTVSGRPILNLSLAINYAFGGTAVWGYHAVNLAIHVLAGLTLFGILRRTLHSRGFAFSVALLWTVHPLQTEAVTYVIQRAESLMGLFYLLTLYGFVRAVDRPADGLGQAGSARNRRPLVYLALSTVACLLGMATKEVMVSAPLIVFLYDRTFVAGSFAGAWTARRRYYLALASTWLVLAALVAGAGDRGGSAGIVSAGRWFAYLGAQLHAIPLYLRLAVWPRPLVFFYGAAPADAGFLVVVEATFVLGLAAATAAALRCRPAWGFLGAAFFAILAPSSLVPVVTETVAEHRMYLALIPVLVAGVAALRRVFGPRRTLVVACAFGLAAVAATAARNRAYASDLGLWADTTAKVPDNAVARNDYGAALRLGGFQAEAMAEFQAALRLDPRYVDAWNNLGATLADLGRPSEAVVAYNRALALDPGGAKPHFNWGIALQQLGDLDGAVAQYREALRLMPDYPLAAFNLGTVFAREGRLAEAENAFREAVRVDPDSPEAHNNLGAALANEGQWDAARAEFLRALALKPDYASPRANLKRLQALGH